MNHVESFNVCKVENGYTIDVTYGEEFDHEELTLVGSNVSDVVSVIRNLLEGNVIPASFSDEA